MLTNGSDRHRQQLRELVERHITDLLLEDDRESSTYSDTNTLVELGLNSLMLAQLLIELESATGTDPFADGSRSVADVRSLGDLVDVYTSAGSGAPA